MIKANELRIGNRLKPIRVLDPENIPLIGYAICAAHIAYSKEELNADWGPIPLTPQILEKFGFKKDKVTGDYWDMVDEYGFSKQNFVIFHHEDGAFSIGSSLGEYSIGKPFRYLHQLQNSFFALTGEELEI